MSETPQQYTQKILSYIQGQDPVKVQSATPKKLARLTRGISAAKLRKRPEPQKWSVAEILAHLADAEIVMSWRVRSILGYPGIAIQTFDQDSWASAMKYEKHDPRLSLAQMRAVREANVALYKSLTPEQWKQFGIHPERGQESIENIVCIIAGHDINHLQQIERILAARKRRADRL